MDRPLVTEDNAVRLADEIFGLKVDSSSVDTVKELESYDDRNFYIWGVKDGEEGAYLLKVYNGCYAGCLYSRDFVDAIHKVMFCLQAGGVICPVPQKTMSGECVEIRNFKATPSSQHKVKKPKHDAKTEELFPSYVCLFTFVPGKTMKDRKVHGHLFNDDTYYNIGQFVANIANVLKDLQCSTLEEREFHWDIYHFDTMLQGPASFTPEEKKLMKAVQDAFKKFVKPQLGILPKQCIHGDINDGNIVVKENPSMEQFAVIDFGDVNYSCRVFEIAITAAYMMLVAEDNKLKAAATTVAGFHDKCPLTKAESDVIFYCMQARLCQSSCFGIESSNAYPDNAEYLLYHAREALKILKTLADSSKDDFDQTWRDLCKN